MTNSFEMETLFGLNHKPKPICYSADVTLIFKILLWYAPNVGSFQTQQDFLIDKEYISNEIFDFFCSYMEIDPDKVECEDYTLGSIVDQNVRRMTLGDDKFRIIMTYGNSKTNNRTKMQSLLEHLRNSIAHGRFSIVDDTQFIGFDYNGSKYTFFIRIGVKQLKLMLGSLTVFDYGRNPSYVELMVHKVFLSLNNYIVLKKDTIPSQNRKIIPDLLVRNVTLDMIISVEIKIANKISSVDRYDEGIYPESIPIYYDKLILLLIIPNKKIADNTIRKMNSDHIVVLDRIKLKLFLNGEDVFTDQLE